MTSFLCEQTKPNTNANANTYQDDVLHADHPVHQELGLRQLRGCQPHGYHSARDHTDDSVGIDQDQHHDDVLNRHHQTPQHRGASIHHYGSEGRLRHAPVRGRGRGKVNGPQQ